MEPAQPTEDAPRSSLWRWTAPLLITLAGIVALVYFLAPYRSQVRTAVDRASLGSLLAMTALSLVALALRTEVWRAGLAAAGRRPPRSDLHAANAATMLTALANHYIAPGVKMWLLRKMEGERAAYLLKLVTIDIATAVLEAFLAGVLVVIAAFSVALQWWIPVLLLSGAGIATLVALVAWRRHPEHPVVEGFSVLMRPRYRWQVLILLSLVFGAQIVRAWLSLRTVGVPIGLGDAMLVFVLTGVLGVLPSGVTAAPTAASLIVVGSHGIGRAAGSGILVTGSLVAATIGYCLISAAARWVIRRGSAGETPANAAAPGATLERSSQHSAG
jgi:uncharacterized membrane protein YbhN (UPF0104 family)